MSRIRMFTAFIVLFCFSQVLFAASILTSSAEASKTLFVDNDRNTVSVYSLSGGSLVLQGTLTNPTGNKNDFFGSSSAFSADGNTLVISAYAAGTNSAARAGLAHVYVYSLGVWSYQATLQASDPSTDAQFGISSAISADGNTVLIGANLADPSAVNNAGAAYVFTRSGAVWSQQAKLTASDATAEAALGVSVSLSSDGSTAAIGASGASASGKSGSGKTYTFTRSGSSWTQQQILAASNANAYDAFGASVSLAADGNTLLVGAPGADTNTAINTGAAYVFSQSGGIWTEEKAFILSSAPINSEYGIKAILSSDGTTITLGGLKLYTSQPLVFTKSLGVWGSASTYTNGLLYKDAYLGNEVSGGESRAITTLISGGVFDTAVFDTAVFQ